MIWGMLRVKNEARWIERVIRSLTICDQILVFDDHSTDKTSYLCERMGCKVYGSPFKDLNEGRDKDYLLQRLWDAGAQVGDWVVMIDGDEILVQQDIPILQVYINAGVHLAAAFKILYLWNSEDQVRVDKGYGNFNRPSAFKLFARDLSFMKTSHGGGFHCSNVPHQIIGASSLLPVRLLHLGYLHKEDRLKKYQWYNSIDNVNPFEDGYRHMVVGDIFPPDSEFRHGGPLLLTPLRDLGVEI